MNRTKRCTDEQAGPGAPTAPGLRPRPTMKGALVSIQTMTHRLVNLTQHHLRIKTADGNIVTIRSDVADGKASLPHVDEHRQEVVFNAVMPNNPDGRGPTTFFMYEIERGSVRNIPPPRPGTMYVVSMRVLEAIREQHPERSDFITPGNAERLRGVIQYAYGFHYLV